MLIVSWNVAGLKPALQKIHSDYGTSSINSGVRGNGNNSANDKTSTTKSKTPITDPFANYLALHNSISILCLQEHKIPLAQLSSRSEPMRCSSIDGYESFWSCATAQNARGFNGVVTYAKTGLVQGADAAPLKDAELDKQGRCVMTDHGKFVLFNVYVPCGRGGEEAAQSLHNKMKFLNALSAAMDRQRERGKHVVLVGDMNLKIGKKDVYWKSRALNVNDILTELKQCSETIVNEANRFPKWKWDVKNHWEEIERVLQTIEAIPRQTTNPQTKETFNKFRARVKIGENNYANLGNYEDEAYDAIDYYTFDERSYIDPSNNQSTVYAKKNLMCLDTLAELMLKIANVSWNEKTLREIAESEETGANPDSPVYQWIRKRLDGDEMVDVFRHFYPTAEARFTCWHQLKNKRYTNEGARIDYTFVDKPLMDFVEPNDGKTLRCGKEPHSNPLGEEAALMAATAGGLFEPGTYAGGGIAVATKRALDTQFGESHTGMIYTPPSYSDHIAVSLLMKSSFKDYVGQLDLDSESSTRKAQPHKKQRSISSFFGAAGSKPSSSSSIASSKSASSSSGVKRTISQNDSTDKAATKKSSFQSYFGGSKQAAKENGSSSRSSSSSNNTKKQRSVPKNSVLKHFGKK